MRTVRIVALLGLLAALLAPGLLEGMSTCPGGQSPHGPEEAAECEGTTGSAEQPLLKMDTQVIRKLQAGQADPVVITTIVARLQLLRTLRPAGPALPLYLQKKTLLI